MATRRCPKCQLSNPGSAQFCDCGWSFVSGAYRAPLRASLAAEMSTKPDERRQKAKTQIFIGCLAFALGLFITVATYSDASGASGGTYVIAYGPMIFGLFSFVRGVSALN